MHSTEKPEAELQEQDAQAPTKQALWEVPGW
jgi:hypothetical protein